MRVLIALNAYEEDGPGHLIYRLCERLVVREDLRLTTVALSRGGPLMDRFRALGIGAEVVSSRGLNGIVHLRDWAKVLVKRSDCPDLIHTHLLWPDFAMRLVHRQLGRLPLASTCHGLHALDEKGMLAGVAYRLLDRSTRSRCSAWVAISRYTLSRMRTAGFPEDRLFLIGNGVDCVQIHPLNPISRQEIRTILNVDETTPLLVAAGTLRSLKGHDVLLRAMPAIIGEFPDTRLLIFGEGPSREALQALIAELGIAENVKLIGQLSTMLAQVLAAADVVVHPSRLEAFGLVAAEAQAAGTPVIASRVGGLPEVVEDGVGGFLVEPDKPDAIAARVIELLEDDEKRESMGMAGRHFVNENHEIGTTAEGYRELWWRLAAGRPFELFPGEEEQAEEDGLRVDSKDYRLPDT